MMKKIYPLILFSVLFIIFSVPTIAQTIDGSSSIFIVPEGITIPNGAVDNWPEDFELPKKPASDLLQKYLDKLRNNMTPTCSLFCDSFEVCTSCGPWPVEEPCCRTERICYMKCQ